MEGTLDKWEGIMSGWKSNFVVLFDDLLILSEHKGGTVLEKLNVKEIKIDPKTEQDSQFCLSYGFKKYAFNAKDIREKVKWVTAIKTSLKSLLEIQKQGDAMTKIAHVQKNMDSMTIDYDIETLVNNNTSSSKVREKISYVWLLQAKLSESLANLNLKIPPNLRASDDFDSIATVGNELKVDRYNG